MLHKQLQGSAKTLIDANRKLFGFAKFIDICQKYF